MGDQPAAPASSANAAAGGILLLSIGFSIFVIVVNDAPMVTHSGWFTKLLAFVAGSIMGVVGYNIGDAMRRFVMPDAVFTSGGFFTLMGTKLFWKFGPQLIGLAAGVFVMEAIIFKFL